jgi:hypothetical protein
MDFKAPKQNTSIATLIRNYQNKKSGKVVESRREIQRRFKCLDWAHQKKMLLALINASATDRDWAYRTDICEDRTFKVSRILKVNGHSFSRIFWNQIGDNFNRI